MDIIRAEQIALDDALVAPANRLKIGKSNLRLSLDLNSKEATLQVVYDVLKLTPFYKAFQITTDVPEIYIGEIKVITDVNVNKLHQPWRSFAVGMYHKKNVDYAYLLWEDFVYQVENNNVKRSNEMYYPRFTKLYGAILPNELTNEAIKDSDSYKEYYVIALGAEPLKTKASVKKKQARYDKVPNASQGKRLKATAKLPRQRISSDEDDNAESENDDDDDDANNQDDDGQEYDVKDDENQDDDNEQTDSDNDGDDFVHPKFSTHDEEDKEEDSFVLASKY
ncbi:hypothetical protein Tco_0290939 [Tanacetum coccineum]